MYVHNFLFLHKTSTRMLPSILLLIVAVRRCSMNTPVSHYTLSLTLLGQPIGDTAQIPKTNYYYDTIIW